MRIAVIGTGHVGLPTCVALAHLGHSVTGVDADVEKVQSLHAGSSPFYERALDRLLQQGLEDGRLAFTSDPASAIPEADVVFICVGTPTRPDGTVDLRALESAAKDIARHAAGRTLVVEKSTVPAGTAERVKRTLKRERPDLPLEVASNPEFLREGRAVDDSLQPSRILVGAESPWAFEQLRRVYQPIVDRTRLIETDISTAELSKHACNAFLALKISFANALARVCERSGSDVVTVTEVMGADPRIGPDFLRAGLGYGGYCFPKDLQAFERLSDDLGYDFNLLGEVARINDEAIEAARNKIEDALWTLEGKRVTLLGLAFKPETDDIRFSPAMALARRLLDEGVEVVGCDPQALRAAKDELPELEAVLDPYEAATGAHCVVTCTEWEQFATLDLARLRDAMRYPIVVDARNIYDPNEMRAAGFAHYPTGRIPTSDWIEERHESAGSKSSEVSVEFRRGLVSSKQP